MTTSRSRGRLTVTSLRLCSRAPRMTMCSCATELLNGWKPHVQAENSHILAMPGSPNVCSVSYHGGPDGGTGSGSAGGELAPHAGARFRLDAPVRREPV